VSVKVKDALLRRRFSDRQIGVAYDYLTRTDHDVMGGMLGLATYGGRINTVAPDATASSQRDSILDLACTAAWLDPRMEQKNLTEVRAFYRDRLEHALERRVGVGRRRATADDSSVLLQACEFVSDSDRGHHETRSRPRAQGLLNAHCRTHRAPTSGLEIQQRSAALGCKRSVVGRERSLVPVRAASDAFANVR
jgi:hypothetical protein